MKMNHLFRVLLIFSIFFTGCEENFPYEDILDLSAATSENSSSYSLSVNQMDVFLDESESYTKTIEVNSSNVNWTITAIPEWLTVTPTNGGNGKTEVKITATDLSAEERRAVQLKLQSTTTEYSWSEYFTVHQGASLEGHVFVDLGLPSGVKWATCNVGATKPEEYGAYYAWGEVNIKVSYTTGNSLTYDKSGYNINISGDIRYDAASYLWKGSWRMPTEAEFSELVNNCVWEWMAVNGVNGYKVTSIANGNSIFLPAAGYKDGSSLYGQGSYARYWSGTYYSEYSSSSSYYNERSYYFYFALGSYRTIEQYRYYGMPIRPVCE